MFIGEFTMSPDTIDCRSMTKTKLKDTFWLDGFEGKCMSGYYFRNDVGKKIEAFEKECGRKVVGITLDREGWNIEFILERKEGEEDGHI